MVLGPKFKVIGYLIKNYKILFLCDFGPKNKPKQPSKIQNLLQSSLILFICVFLIYYVIIVYLIDVPSNAYKYDK